jgi:hypothetical protein
MEIFFIPSETYFLSSIYFRFVDQKLLFALLQRSGVINHLDHIRIETESDAQALINHLQPKERALLIGVLQTNAENEAKQQNNHGHISYPETKQLFMFNALPFVGFGILDNMIMILAGEYIDQSLGAMLSISTMAAAALGNIISDVAG